MDVLIVGSLAYDSIVSPLGAVENALGGSATYAGLSCAFHRNRLGLESVGLVGVVGSDFRKQDRRKFIFFPSCSTQCLFFSPSLSRVPDLVPGFR